MHGIGSIDLLVGHDLSIIFSNPGSDYMRKATFFALLPLFFLLFSQQAFADGVTLNKVNPGEWKILDSSGETLGTLKTMEDGSYSVQYAAGDLSRNNH